MIETCHLKNVVIFFQTTLSFVLSRKIINRELLWVKMIDIQKGLSKNISDLVRKDIQGIYETTDFTKKKKKKERKYIRTKQERSKKPTDDSKIKYFHSDVMEKIIKNCRGVKKWNDEGFKEHSKIMNKE